MATRLTKPVVRIARLRNAQQQEGDVHITTAASGIAFHNGKRRLATIPWAEICKLAKLPPNAPARFASDPLGWVIEKQVEKS